MVQDPLPQGFFETVPGTMRARFEESWSFWLQWCDRHEVDPLQATYGELIDHVLDRRTELWDVTDPLAADAADALDTVSLVFGQRIQDPLDPFDERLRTLHISL